MKTSFFATVLALVLVLGSVVHAEHYKYRSLIIKDYDEMTKMVQERIGKAKDITEKDGSDGSRDAEAVEYYRDALKLVFSRPNSDNMVAKLTPEIRRDLMGLSAYEDTISSLMAEAIGVVKGDVATVTQKSTSLFIIENILNEIKVEAKRSVDLKRVIQRLADADLKISKEVKKDRNMGSMFSTKSPSEEAKRVLKSISTMPEEKK